MKLLSWNILMYITKNQDIITKARYIVDEIKRINPDILMLQEASEYFLGVLLDQSNYNRHIHVLTHGGLVVILTKPSIKVSESLFFNDIGVGVRIGDKTVVTCHLVPGKNNQKFRQGQLDEIITRSGLNVLIMGDMNMTNYQNFESKSMIDVALVNKNCDDTWFLSYHIKSNMTSRRFDRVYTDMKTMNYTVYQTYKYLSDHVPISIWCDDI
jgi:endonuclease/exonuclease/phosphatase family metal-dependent hydrolase